MAPNDWQRVHDFHQLAQAEIREQILCRKRIRRQIVTGIRNTAARLTSFNAYRSEGSFDHVDAAMLAEARA